LLEQLGLAPHECLAIEDSAAGLQSATAAGLRTVVTVNDYTRDQDFSGALTVLSDFGERDAPARVLAGASADGDVIDVAQLKAWHAGAQGED